MLAWRIEEVSFTNSKYRSYGISIIIHVVLAAFIYCFAMLSASMIEATLLPIDEAKTMPVSIVSYDSKMEKKFRKSAMQKPLAANNSKVDDDKPEAIIKLEDLQKTKANNAEELPNPPKIERYEQLLAQHVANNLPELPHNIVLPDRVDIWIKLDKQGDIYDFGVIPKQDTLLEDILKAAILDSSPVPTPPEDAFSSDFAQYLIPLVFSN